MAKASLTPSVVTVATAADVLRRYKAGVLSDMGRPAWTPEGDGYEQVEFTERQVRYAMAGMGHPLYVPQRKGDPMLIDTIELSMLALFIAAGEYYGLNRRAAWAALLYCGDQIRDAIGHPERKLTLEIRSSRVTIRPSGGPVPQDAISVTAGELRADVENLVKASLTEYPVSPLVAGRAAIPLDAYVDGSAVM